MVQRRVVAIRASVFSVEHVSGARMRREYLAFARLRVHRARIREYLPMLRLWISQAHPPGRLYAAVLIGLVDAVEGRAALRTLRRCGALILVQHGRHTRAMTVGETAFCLGEQVGKLWMRVVDAPAV